MNLQDFCAGLGEYVPAGEHYSIPTVNRWERGIYAPPVTWLYWMRDHAPADSWQRDFATKAMELLTTNGGNTDNVHNDFTTLNKELHTK